MKARPVNMKSHEVLAILQGSKTQLRRIVSQQPASSQKWVGWEREGAQLNATWANSEGLFGEWVWVVEFKRVDERGDTK